MNRQMKLLEISFSDGIIVCVTTELTSFRIVLPRSALWRFRNQE